MSKVQANMTTCPRCKGRGWVDVEVRYFHDIGMIETCTACWGKGEVEHQNIKVLKRR